MQEKETAAKFVRQVERVLWLYSLLVIALTIAAWGIYLVARNRTSSYRPLFRSSDRHQDLMNYRDKIAHLHDGAAALARGLPVFNYPAPTAYILKFFLKVFGDQAPLAYLFFLGLCIAGFALVAWRALGAEKPARFAAGVAILVTACIGEPLIFVADRANLEGVVWALAGAGLCFLMRRKFWSSAVLLGIAAAVKPFPGLFFLIMLRLGRYKETALGVCVSALLFVAALWSLGPNPVGALRDMLPGVSLYKSIMVDNLQQSEEARFEHSLLDEMKAAAVLIKVKSIRPSTGANEIGQLMGEPGGWRRARQLANLYLPLTVIAFGIIVALFYKMPILNQVTAVAVAVALLPPSASEYTLLHLYVPFGAFLVFAVREVATGRSQLSTTTLASFGTIYALLFSPLTFLQLYAGSVKMLLLLALLIAAARTPMRSADLGDVAAPGSIT